MRTRRHSRSRRAIHRRTDARRSAPALPPARLTAASALMLVVPLAGISRMRRPCVDRGHSGMGMLTAGPTRRREAGSPAPRSSRPGSGAGRGAHAAGTAPEERQRHNESRPDEERDRRGPSDSGRDAGDVRDCRHRAFPSRRACSIAERMASSSSSVQDSCRTSDTTMSPSDPPKNVRRYCCRAARRAAAGDVVAE